MEKELLFSCCESCVNSGGDYSVSVVKNPAGHIRVFLTGAVGEVRTGRGR